MSEPWRYRCPEGHTSIEQRSSKEAYRCRSCERTYYGEPVDVKRDRGGGGEGVAPIVPIAAVRRLWRAAGDTDTTLRARHVASDRAAALAQALRDAVDRGYVERLERGGGDRYRVTERGARIMRRGAGAQVEA